MTSPVICQRCNRSALLTYQRGDATVVECQWCMARAEGSHRDGPRFVVGLLRDEPGDGQRPVAGAE